MKGLVFALDLSDEPAAIASLRASGLANLEIFRTGNRPCLIMDAPEEFSPSAKVAAAATDPEIQAGERLMSRYQRVLNRAAPGGKRVPMQRLFSLAERLQAVARAAGPCRWPGSSGGAAIVTT